MKAANVVLTVRVMDEWNFWPGITAIKLTETTLSSIGGVG